MLATMSGPKVEAITEYHQVWTPNYVAQLSYQHIAELGMFLREIKNRDLLGQNCTSYLPPLR